MKHKIKVSVSKQLQSDGVVACKCKTVRERILSFLFGEKKRITILIPGDSVDELAICETDMVEVANG